MSEITSDSGVMAALRQQMTLAAARQAVAASNLANVNTPGYKAREADFEQTLDGSSATACTLTNAAPPGRGGAVGPGHATKPRASPRAATATPSRSTANC